MSTQGEAAAALWFLAPGLAHKLGNALFAVHGRARLLTMADAELARDRDAILDGVGRAQEGLAVVRWLLGENSEETATAGAVVAALVEVLRVPLRDRGFVVDAPEPAPKVAAAPVLAAAFCQLLAFASRLMIADAIPTPGGTLTVELLPGEDDTLVLRLALAPVPGALPFPVDPAGVCERLSQTLAAAKARSISAPAGTTAVDAGRQVLLRLPVAARH